MSNKRTNILGPVLIVVLVGGFLAVQHSRPKQKPVLTQSSIQKETGVPVTFVHPRRQSVDDVLNVTGQLAADSTTTLSSKVPGKVLFVTAREGDTVAAGQVVVQLDDADARRQLDQAVSGVLQARAGLQVAEARLSQARTGKTVGDTQTLANVAAAKAALRSAKARYEMVVTGARRQERIQSQNAVASARAALDKAQSDFTRYKALADQGAVSAATLDGFRTALDVARAQHNSAVQNASMVKEGARSEYVRQAEAAVQQASESLRAAIAAKGTVSTRREDINAAVAGVASAKAQVAAAKAAVAIAKQNVDNFKVRSPRAGSVTVRGAEPGQYASSGQGLMTVVDLNTIFLKADISEVAVERVRPGLAVNVRVDAIPDMTWRGRVQSVIASADPSSRSFTAKVVIANRDHSLRPNMFARAGIITGRIPDALLVPKDAVIQRDGTDVVVRIINGKAELVSVVPGVAVGNDIVVRAAQLSPRDKVVTTGQQDLTDGQIVLEQAQ